MNEANTISIFTMNLEDMAKAPLQDLLKFFNESPSINSEYIFRLLIQ